MLHLRLVFASVVVVACRQRVKRQHQQLREISWIGDQDGIPRFEFAVDRVPRFVTFRCDSVQHGGSPAGCDERRVDCDGLGHTQNVVKICPRLELANR